MRSSDYFNEPFFCRLETREYNPDYNLVLIRPLFFKQRDPKISKECIANDLEKMISACINLQHFKNEIIEIKPTICANKRIGLDITDQTHGFPVLEFMPYATSKNPKTGKDNPSRLNAFYNALRDVSKNKESILELMWEKRNNEWVQLEPYIKELLDYSYLNKKNVC